MINREYTICKKKTLQRCKLDNYEVMNMTIMLLSVCDSGLE